MLHYNSIFLLDPRTQTWAFVNSFTPSLVSILCYLLFVYIGPKFMKDREPIEFKRFMMIYNMGATLLNIHIFVEVHSYNYIIP